MHNLSKQWIFTPMNRQGNNVAMMRLKVRHPLRSQILTYRINKQKRRRKAQNTLPPFWKSIFWLFGCKRLQTWINKSIIYVKKSFWSKSYLIASLNFYIRCGSMLCRLSNHFFQSRFMWHLNILLLRKYSRQICRKIKLVQENFPSHGKWGDLLCKLASNRFENLMLFKLNRNEF